MEEDSEATLEVTIHSAERRETSKFLSKSKTFAIAWIDPSSKQKTPKDLQTHFDQKLHFPLTSEALRSSTSELTIQVLASRPLQGPRLLGVARLPLASVGLVAADPARLQLRRPGGGERGGGASVRVSARVLWCLGPAPPDAEDVVPTAPPMPEAMPADDSAAWVAEVVSAAARVNSMVPAPVVQEVMLGKGAGLRALLPMAADSDGHGAALVREAAAEGPDGGGAWRSFLVGMASGAVAVAAMMLGAAAEFSRD